MTNDAIVKQVREIGEEIARRAEQFAYVDMVYSIDISATAYPRLDRDPIITFTVDTSNKTFIDNYVKGE